MRIRKILAPAAAIDWQRVKWRAIENARSADVRPNNRSEVAYWYRIARDANHRMLRVGILLPRLEH